MMRDDDIHSAAERFLREYLSQTGSKTQPVELSAAASAARHVSASQAAAKEFLKDHLKKIRLARSPATQAEAITSVERYEVEEPRHVRSSPGAIRDVFPTFMGSNAEYPFSPTTKLLRWSSTPLTDNS